MPACSIRVFLVVIGVMLGFGSLSSTSSAVGAENKRTESERTARLRFSDLTCEYRRNPLGIDAEAPRLSWKLRSDARGARQTAYRLQVSEGGDAFSKDALVWDTGKVDSEESVHHVYEGAELEPRTRYHWRVKVWDENGTATGWSAPQWWEMGLLQPSDWDAAWIAPGWDEDTGSSPPSPTLRSAFEVAGGEVASARLYVTAYGLYEAYLNGAVIGEELFTPGWTSYHERLQYQTFDVTEQVQQGENVLGARLGDGWYRGYLGWYGQRNRYGEELALLAQLEVTYESGETEVVARTQSSGWQATPEGPLRRSDIYNGEVYDARREMPGWSAPGYDASSWAGVQTVEYSKEILVAPAAPPTRRIQTLRPRRIFETPEGDTVVDLGQNMVGWVRLRVEGAAGTEVTLRHAEVLDRDGNFYDANLRAADAEDRYILKGSGGPEVYEPRFTFHGFRYVAVDGYPGELTLDDVEGVVIHSATAPTGHFQSSSALLNQLQSNIVWGQKGNFLDVPTDTPARDERLGWTGDVQAFAQTAAYNMDVAAFFTKWLRDLATDQYEDGSIPHVVPNVLDGFGGQKAAGAAGWADAGVVLPWVLYQRYGDTRILRRQYDSMKAWVGYMRETARDGDGTYIWDTGFQFGDWLAYNTTEPGYPGATTEPDLIATAFFAHSAQLVAQAARVLGRPEEAASYDRLAAQVREAFRAEFVTERGRVTSSTQTAYVLALSFGLLDGEQEAAAARRLAANVRQRGHLTTGFLGTPDLLHVLGQYGYYDEAYALLMRTDYPSWLYPSTQGATTMWERWDGVKPDGTFQTTEMNSFNHYAYGAVGDWMYREVAGLQPAAPGYKRIRIAPTPGGGLAHARARYESVHGPAESSWTVDGDTFRLEVHIPANTRAEIRLPRAGNANAVREGATPLTQADGVANVRRDADDIVLEVGSGRYVFTYATPEAFAALAGGEDASLTAESTLAELMADVETRAVIAERLPQVYASPWLSQAMNFPLARVADVIPTLDLSDEDIAAATRAIDQVSR